MSLTELFAGLQNSKKNPSQVPRAVITFDDGYRDVWDYAWPILKRFSISPSFFVCTDPLIRKKFLVYDRLIPWVQSEIKNEILFIAPDGSNRLYSLRTQKGKEVFVREATGFLMGYGREDRNALFEQYLGTQKKDSIEKVEELYLSLKELKAALKEGVEVGSHTDTHPDLPLLPREEWDEEIKKSKQQLEFLLEKTVDFFSYPAGRYNMAVRDYVREAGYLGAVATGKRAISWSNCDPYALPRISPEGIATLGKFYALVSGIRPGWFMEGFEG